MIYYPHGIAFFNLFAGGPNNGLRYLADSNLDWGQDLPAFRAWVTRNNGRGLRLAYFGADTPWRHFTGKESVSTPPPWNDALRHQSHAAPRPLFQVPVPTARAGYSIYIYDLRVSDRPAALDPLGQTAAPPVPNRLTETPAPAP